MSSRLEELLNACLGKGGCEFKPRSRAEVLLYALKQKLDSIGGGGSGGGTVDGLVIKTITFTDRPSAWEWIKTNYDKILRLVLSTNQYPIPRVYDNFDVGTDGEKLTEVSFYFIFPFNLDRTDIISFATSCLKINENYVEVLMNDKSIMFTNNVSPTIDEDALQTLPDEYWQALSAQVTIYYMGKAESGGGGGENYSLSAVQLLDDEGNGPLDVTYKTVVNGALETKTKTIESTFDLKIVAVIGTEIFINKPLNCFGRDDDWETIYPTVRHADGGMYITVPDTETCTIAITS